jgi:gamma-glutamylputrescine oxidase
MAVPLDLKPFGLPFWLDLQRPEFPSLNRNRSVEAVVIGAGIAGLKLARCLNRHGIETVILEAGRAGDGASSRNQGSINHGPGMNYLDCIERYSRQVARELWQLGLDNHRMLRAQIDEYDIDCDYQIDGMTSLIRRDLPGRENLIESYRREYELLRDDGFDVSLLDEREAICAGGNEIYAGGLRYEDDAQFHSGKFVLGLAQAVARLPNVDLFEATRARRIKDVGAETVVVTGRHEIRARYVFLSTNALAPQFVPDLEKPLRAERGQVFVTEPLSECPCRGSFGTPLAWWREIPEPDGRFRLLFGGGRTRDEPDSLFPQFDERGQPHPELETEGSRPSVAHQQRLDAQFAKLFPRLTSARITHRWGGLQSFTADDLPQIGLFDSDRRIYGIAGFCGRGNCYSDVGAEYLVATALGIPSELEPRFHSLIESIMKPRRPAANWVD